MTTPTPPPAEPPYPSNPSGGKPSIELPPSYAKENYMDPAGVWYKFFQSINPGQPVTVEQVKAFQNGLMKWFSAIIQHENASWKRIYDEMKKNLQE